MLFAALRILIICACCVAAGAFGMHVLQLKRYDIAGYRRQMRRRGEFMLRPELLIALTAALANWYLPILLSMAVRDEVLRKNLCGWLVLGLFAAATLVLYLLRRRVPQKKPFVCTHRVCRLIGVTFALDLLGVAILTLLSLSPYFFFAISEYALLLAALILRPLEDRINLGFYNQARAKLAARKDLIRIGITGSSGKTETKMILKTLLSEKYKVLATPASFSTAMGVSRTVNDQLRPEHEIFIAEMGAQRKGEIRELTRLVAPKYGLLTSIDRSHIDSFGSIENIAQTKFELMQGLPKDGAGFFASDAGYVDRLYAMFKGEKYRAAIGSEVACSVYAHHIETNVHGTRFELECADGARAWVHTQLLGNYSVLNIALCAALARKLGMDMAQIAEGIEKLRPLRHHLQLIPGDICIIDNSLNALPASAAEALRVLKSFPGRRILVTGGFAELEDAREDREFAYGMQIGGCADSVILFGAQATRAVYNGLTNAHFPKSALQVVNRAEDLAAALSQTASGGDSVLFEGVDPDLALRD